MEPLITLATITHRVVVEDPQPQPDGPGSLPAEHVITILEPGEIHLLEVGGSGNDSGNGLPGDFDPGDLVARLMAGLNLGEGLGGTLPPGSGDALPAGFDPDAWADDLLDTLTF